MKKLLKTIYVRFKFHLLKKLLFIGINRLIQRKPSNFESSKLAIEDAHVFFGYYDIQPSSDAGDKVLANVVDRDVKKLSGNELLEVGFFDDQSVFHKVGESKSWCWQQGCRLQWYPDSNNSLVIYNTLVGQKYGAVIQNVDRPEDAQFLDYPVYDLNSDGSYGLSLNFSRLQNLRPGYGYSNFPDAFDNQMEPKKDGVFLIDVKNNSSQLIIPTSSLVQHEAHESMQGAFHYINHLSWNPSGSRFLFFHLWTKGDKRYSRLFTADKNGRDLFLLLDKFNVSHYDWRNDEEIIITCSIPDVGERYLMLKDLTNEYSIIESDKLKMDGHPTFHPLNKDLILSDTYPNKRGERELFIFNLKSKESFILGAYYSPLKFSGEYRCDLHPRWSVGGTSVIIDSTHNKNKRSIYKIENV